MVYFAKSHSFTTFAVPNSKNIKQQNKMQKTTHLFEKSKRRSSLPLGGVGGGLSLFILLLSATLLSCHGNSKGNGENDSIWIAPQQSDSILSLDDINASETLLINGEKISYVFRMSPADSLPIVTNLDGTRYKDNIVNLTVSRGNDVILKREFTKYSFKDYVPSNDMSNCALVGFSYNLNETNDSTQLRFIATVGDPDETAGVNYPTEILISPNGNIKMQVAKDIETEPEFDNLNEEPSEDEGV